MGPIRLHLVHPHLGVFIDRVKAGGIRARLLDRANREHRTVRAFRGEIWRFSLSMHASTLAGFPLK